MGYQIKRREYGTGTDRRGVHFELWLDGRRLPTAAAVVEERGATVNWSALGDVPPRLALDFAQGLAALVHTVCLEDAERLRVAAAPPLTPIADANWPAVREALDAVWDAISGIVDSALWQVVEEAKIAVCTKRSKNLEVARGHAARISAAARAYPGLLVPVQALRALLGMDS